MAVNLSPVGGAAAQFFDNSGNVLTGGKLYTYLAGTTTPAVTYTSSSGSTPWSNPIILDAAGRVSGSGEIWLTDSIQYKFILKDSNDILIATYDNLTGINSNFVNFTGEEETQTATQGQTVFTLTAIQYQPGVNNLLVFVNGSKQVSGVNYQETSGTVVTFASGLNVGDVVDFCTATPINTSVMDASQVSYDPPFTGSVATNVEDKLSEFITPQDFGAVADGVTDDATAIENAAIYCQANGRPLLILGTYGVEKVTFNGLAGLNITYDATFNAIATSPQTALFEMVDCSNIYTTGSLQLNVNYNTNYDVAFWLYGATSSQFFNLQNISVGAAKLAYRFGSASYSDATISEITVNGGHTYGCPSVFQAYGSNLVMAVEGVNWNSDLGANPAGWASLPNINVNVTGGTVTFNNSEVLMPAISTGILFQVRPMASVVFNNRYGSLYVNNCTVETQSPLARAINDLSVPTPEAASGVLQFTNCSSFNGTDAAAYIFTTTDYTGKVVVQNNNFFASVSRSSFNIQCDGNALVYVDKQSFATNYQPWIAGVSGGLVQYMNGMTLFKNATQAIAATTWVKVTATGTVATGLRGGDQPNSRFVAPVYGVYSVQFNTYGSSSSAASELTTAIYKNGSVILTGVSNYTNAANQSTAANVSGVFTLNAGDIIEFYAYASAANFTLNNSTGLSNFIVYQVQ